MPPYNYLAKTQRLIFFEFDATRHTIIVRFRNTCCCRLHLHHFIQPLKINIDLTPQIYTLTPNPTRLKRIIIRYQFSHTKCIFTIKIGTIEIIDERTPRLVIHNWLNDWRVYYYIFLSVCYPITMIWYSIHLNQLWISIKLKGFVLYLECYIFLITCGLTVMMDTNSYCMEWKIFSIIFGLTVMRAKNSFCMEW